MTTKSQGSPRTGQLPVPLFVFAVVILVGFVGWVAYRNFGPQPIPPPPPKNANVIRMERIYKASGGDINKLSAEDRSWLHEYSGGRDEQAFQYYKTSAGR